MVSLPPIRAATLREVFTVAGIGVDDDDNNTFFDATIADVVDDNDDDGTGPSSTVCVPGKQGEYAEVR